MSLHSKDKSYWRKISFKRLNYSTFLSYIFLIFILFFSKIHFQEKLLLRGKVTSQSLRDCVNFVKTILGGRLKITN